MSRVARLPGSGGDDMLQIPLPQPTTVPVSTGIRRFLLRWNSRKVKSSRLRADEWQEAQGVQFSAHDALARVALSNGQHFQTLGELEDLLERGGDFSIDWIDN